MFETQRSRQIAEGVAAAPGVGAALYGAIAYDQGNLGNVFARMFSACVDLQVSIFGGDTYYPKLGILMMAVPLVLPPVIAVKLWVRRHTADASAAPPDAPPPPAV